MADLSNLAAHLADGSLEVIGLTTPPRSRKPIKQFPPESWQTWLFQLEESNAHPTAQDCER
jgi:hypothetical protein